MKINRLPNSNIKYCSPEAALPLKEKVISILMKEQATEVGKVLAAKDLELSMYSNLKI